MILHILSFRNKGLKAWSNPHYTDIDPEKCAIQLSRAISSCSPEQRASYKRLALYCLGTFEDETGKFEVLDEPEFLLDCDEIPVLAEPEQVVIEKKEIENGKSC